MEVIKEGSATIKASLGKISRELDVFYNPVMKLNRDFTILILNSIDEDDLQCACPLAGSGVRGVRVLKEVPRERVRSFAFNDIDEVSAEIIRENVRMNGVEDRAEVHNKDANMFLMESTGFDYIDIDPFGTPNPFLENAVLKISRRGIMAVTATDTSALAGSSPNPGIRKYWAVPLKNDFMHETGVRILIRKVQLVAGQFEKALYPVFSYYSDHYYRIFFRCKKGKKEVDNVMRQHKDMYFCHSCLDVSDTDSPCCDAKRTRFGPLWVGDLWDKDLISRMHQVHDRENRKLSSLLSLVMEESQVEEIGSYDVHRISQKEKIGILPRLDDTIGKLRAKGFKASRTHFNLEAVKTDASYSDIVELLRNRK